MIIFLVGYMGCGKSTLGKPLAKALGYEFIDSDNYIEQRCQKSIEEIFSTEGEEYFRAKEHDFLTDISIQDNIVVSTGGGLPCFNQNMDLINKIGQSIYIRISAKMSLDRVSNSKKVRPLLLNKNSDELLSYIEKQMSEREVYYKKSNLVIEGISLTYKDIIKALEIL